MSDRHDIPGPPGAPEVESTVESTFRQPVRGNDLNRRIENRHISVSTSPEFIIHCLPDGMVAFVNEALCSRFSISPGDLIGKSIYDIIPQESRSQARSQHRALTPEKPVVTTEYRISDPDGGISWHQWMLIAVFEGGQNLTGYHAVGRDITERLKTERALRENEERLSFLVENMGDILWTQSLDLRTTYVSPSIFRVLGYTPEERYRQTVEEQLTPESLKVAFERLAHELEIDGRPGVDPDRSVTLELEYYHKNGSILWIENVLRAIRNDKGEVIALQGMSRDITKRRQMEEALRDSVQHLEELSITDNLTGLYNQRHFYNALTLEMTRSQRYGRSLSLMMIDIDDFKVFNDTYGHMEGDRVIEHLGAAIRRCTRKSDVACRYGGEEFVVLLPETSTVQATIMAERMREVFQAHSFHPRNGEAVHKTISIGISQCDAEEGSRSFITRADSLMYEAKRRGKNRVCTTPANTGPSRPSKAGTGMKPPAGGDAMIPDREEAVALLKAHVTDERMLAHSFASEAVMRSLARRLGKNEDLWAMAGLLHDLDIERVEGDLTRHGIEAERILRKWGYDPEMIDAVLRHNETASKLPRETDFHHALAAGETITGLITATALVQPDRKVASVKVKSVVKRMKEKAFAASVRRENILECEQLGIPLPEFVELSLAAMCGVHEQIGL
ncbi:MAG TPA: diguanylate cyclase [Syntrophales bacterium]|nr:diguanylate cyclase [Syntrophales bacterium]